MQHHANSKFFHHSPQVIVREFFHEPDPTSTPKIDIDTVKKSQKKPLPFQAEARSTVWLTGVYRAAPDYMDSLITRPLSGCSGRALNLIMR